MSKLTRLLPHLTGSWINILLSTLPYLTKVRQKHGQTLLIQTEFISLSLQIHIWQIYECMNIPLALILRFIAIASLLISVIPINTQYASVCLCCVL
jgi:hypothetical protein